MNILPQGRSGLLLEERRNEMSIPALIGRSRRVRFPIPTVPDIHRPPSPFSRRQKTGTGNPPGTHRFTQCDRLRKLRTAEWSPMGTSGRRRLPRCCSDSSGSTAVATAGKMAGDAPTRRGHCRRRRAAADIDGNRATGMEPAPGRRPILRRSGTASSSMLV